MQVYTCICKLLVLELCMQAVVIAHRDGVGFIDLELCWFVFIGVHAGREEIEEAAKEVQVLSCHIRHLEYGADPTWM